MNLDQLTGLDIGTAFDRLATVGYVRPATTDKPEHLLAEWRKALLRVRCTPAELADAITAFLVADRKGYWPKPGLVVDHILTARRADPGAPTAALRELPPEPLVPVVTDLGLDGPRVIAMPADHYRRRGRPLATEVTCPDPDCACLAFEVWVPLGRPATERRPDAGPQAVTSVAEVRPRQVPAMIAWRWGHVVARDGLQLVSDGRTRIREATA